MSLRIPRITLSAHVDEGSALGDMSLLCVGYGLHQAWVFSSMFGSASVFGTTAYLASPSDVHITLSYLVSIIVYSACLLFAAATDQRFLDFYISRKTLLGASILGCAGTVVLALSGPVDSTPASFASGVLTGLGSSMLILFWGTTFAKNDTSTIALNTALSVPIAMGVYAVLLHAAPVPFSGMITAVLPLLECAILWAKIPPHYTKRKEMPIFKPLPINRAKFLVRFGAPTAIMGLVLGSLRQTTLQSVLAAATINDQLVLLLASSCAAVTVLVSILARGRNDQWSRYFRPLVPLVVVALLFLSFGRNQSNLMANVALLIGYLCFEAMMWMFFGMMAQRFRISPVLVFGLGRGTLAAGIMAGSLAPIVLVDWSGDMFAGQQLLVMSMFAAIAVAYALLPREREVEAIVVPCPAVRAVSASLENDLVAPLVPADPKAATRRQEGEQGRTEASKSCERFECPRACERADDRTQKSQGPSEARRAMLNTSAASRLASMSMQSAPEQKDRRARGGRFRAKCETVANTYLLSARKTEVMFFLAKGHNAAYIQEKLYISEGTAKTHIRHIYRKLDIHTQQELMRMVESAEESR
ncbi:helix-turn-helix transcriptional regulator [Gordonibacter sp. An230]|nr:helix-turn-helix transcriptional regulator [Gordonibacter sp. An230]